jgi:ABC-type branched-subunit amino acid transport system substrate-binding protein
MMSDGGDSNGAARAIGANNGNTFSTDAAAKVLVKAINARGGLAGRKINLVVAKFDTMGNYATQFEAACASFTQDNRVDVVAGLIAIYMPILDRCLTQAKIPLVRGDYWNSDVTDIADHPTSVGISGPSLNRSLEGLLRIQHSLGELTSNDKIGVIYEECPYDKRVLAQTVQPTARQLGLEIARTAGVECLTSYGQAGSLASGIAGTVLAFRSAGVNKIMFISTFCEAACTLLFSQQAEQQGYEPDYLLTSRAALGILVPQMPARQAKHIRGLGWLPSTDVPPTAGSTPSQRRCLDLYQSEGLRPTSNMDYYAMYASCDPLFVVEAALKASRGASKNGALLAGILGLGDSYSAAGNLGGSTLITSTHRDGPTLAAPFAWSSKCSCVDYSGPPRSF